MKQYKKFNAGGKYSGVVRNIAVNISMALPALAWVKI